MEHKSDELQDLRRAVEHEIANYRYEVPAGCVGTPFSQDRVSADLDSLKHALVDPYWAEVFEQLGSNDGKT